MSRNRAVETRINEARNSYNMDYCSPIDVPPEAYDDKFVYHWARFSVKGEEDNRVEALQYQGWELVPRVKESSIDLDPLGRNPNAKKYYTFKGNILMKLEKEIHAERTDKRTKEHEDKIRNIKIATNDVSSVIRSSGLTGY